MSDATYRRPGLTTCTRLGDLGLEATGQCLEPDCGSLVCRVLEPDDWCRRCGCQGVPRDTVTLGLAHEPSGWRPTALLVTVRRYRCTECSHVWRQDTTTGSAVSGEDLLRRVALGACSGSWSFACRGLASPKASGCRGHGQRRGLAEG